jgi:hypothetical protein
MLYLFLCINDVVHSLSEFCFKLHTVYICALLMKSGVIILSFSEFILTLILLTSLGICSNKIVIICYSEVDHR